MSENDNENDDENTDDHQPKPRSNIVDSDSNSDESGSALGDDFDDYQRLRDFEDYLYENYTSPTVLDL